MVVYICDNKIVHDRTKICIVTNPKQTAGEVPGLMLGKANESL